MTVVHVCHVVVLAAGGSHYYSCVHRVCISDALTWCMSYPVTLQDSCKISSHVPYLSFSFFSPSCVQLENFSLASSWCITCTHLFLFLLFRFFLSFIFPSFTVSYHSITHCEREECKEEDSHFQQHQDRHSLAPFRFDPFSPFWGTKKRGKTRVTNPFCGWISRKISIKGMPEKDGRNGREASQEDSGLLSDVCQLCPPDGHHHQNDPKPAAKSSFSLRKKTIQRSPETTELLLSFLFTPFAFVLR